jgi:hypothetical protein
VLEERSVWLSMLPWCCVDRVRTMAGRGFRAGLDETVLWSIAILKFVKGFY